MIELTKPQRWAAMGVIVASLATSMATAQENAVYGTVKGWTVVAQSTGGRHEGCIMSRPGGGFGLFASRRNGIWWLSFPTAAADGTQVAIDMNVDRASDVVPAQALGGFASAQVSRDWVYAIGQGSTMSVLLDGVQRPLALDGSMAAIGKVEECDTNQGRVPAAAPAPLPVPGTQQVVQDSRLTMGAGCPALGTMPSPNLQDWGNISFANRSGMPLTIFWLDYDGQPVEMGRLETGLMMRLSSTAGHRFIAKDDQMTCHGGTIEVPLGETVHDLY